MNELEKLMFENKGVFNVYGLEQWIKNDIVINIKHNLNFIVYKIGKNGQKFNKSINKQLALAIIERINELELIKLNG